MSDAVVIGSLPVEQLDSATLSRILREYAPMCSRLAASHEAHPERARDLAQGILVAVWRAWPAFRNTSSLFALLVGGVRVCGVIAWNGMLTRRSR